LLFARTLSNVLSVDPGFRSDGLVVAYVDSTRMRLPAEQRRAHEDLVVQRIASIPGVQGAATVAVVTISGDAGGNDVWPETNSAAKFNTLVNFVGTGYFRMLGIPLTAGRD